MRLYEQVYTHMHSHTHTHTHTHTHLVGNASDEGLDIELGGAAPLTGGVGTLQAAGGLPEGGPLAQRGVLDVLKVVLLAHTSLSRGGRSTEVILMAIKSRGGGGGGGGAPRGMLMAISSPGMWASVPCYET